MSTWSDMENWSWDKKSLTPQWQITQKITYYFIAKSDVLFRCNIARLHACEHSISIYRLIKLQFDVYGEKKPRSKFYYLHDSSNWRCLWYYFILHKMIRFGSKTTWLCAREIIAVINNLCLYRLHINNVQCD